MLKVSRFVLVGVMVSVCAECDTLGDSVFKVSRFVWELGVSVWRECDSLGDFMR